MRRPRHLDFKCPTCEMPHTRLVETNDDDTPLEAEVCMAPVGIGNELDGYTRKPGDDGYAGCAGVLMPIDTVFLGYMKTITKGNHDFNDRERERLEKRGDDHWKREGRHEAIERERAMLKKNGMEGTGGVK